MVYVEGNQLLGGACGHPRENKNVENLERAQGKAREWFAVYSAAGPNGLLSLTTDLQRRFQPVPVDQLTD